MNTRSAMAPPSEFACSRQPAIQRCESHRHKRPPALRVLERRQAYFDALMMPAISLQEMEVQQAFSWEPQFLRAVIVLCCSSWCRSTSRRLIHDIHEQLCSSHAHRCIAIRGTLQSFSFGQARGISYAIGFRAPRDSAWRATTKKLDRWSSSCCAASTRNKWWLSTFWCPKLKWCPFKLKPWDRKQCSTGWHDLQHRLHRSDFRGRNSGNICSWGGTVTFFYLLFC